MGQYWDQIGQLYLIQIVAVDALSQTHRSVQNAQQCTPAPVAQASSSVTVGAIEHPEVTMWPRRLLVIRAEGEKVEYLNIRDFASILSKRWKENNNVEMQDGSLLVTKGGTVYSKPKLGNITALQFTEVAMSILGKLVPNGSLSSMDQVVQYASHMNVVTHHEHLDHFKALL